MEPSDEDGLEAAYRADRREGSRRARSSGDVRGVWCGFSLSFSSISIPRQPRTKLAVRVLPLGARLRVETV